MLGEALAYPFVLLRRRPVTVIAALVVGFVVSLLIDQGWHWLLGVAPELTHAPGGAFQVDARWIAAQTGYYILRTAGQSFPVALIFVGAMIDLQVRDRKQGLSFMDGLRVSILTAFFVLLFVAPLQIAQPIILRSALGRGDFMAPLYLGLGVYAFQAIVFVPFLLSWPHTIAVGKIRLYPIWKAPRGEKLAVGSALLLALLGAGVVTVVGAAASGLALTTLMRGHEASVIGYSMLRIWPSLVGAYIIDAACACVYARIVPQRPERVAETF